jgi:hypothetical protein
MEHGAWSKARREVGRDGRDGDIQQAASRTKRSEIRCLRSGVKLISDLRLLTSVMDDFNDLNEFNAFNELTNSLIN